MTPGARIRCRVCGRILGVIRGFEGRVFTLCRACEEGKEGKKKKADRGLDDPSN